MDDRIKIWGNDHDFKYAHIALCYLKTAAKQLRAKLYESPLSKYITFVAVCFIVWFLLRIQTVPFTLGHTVLIVCACSYSVK